MLAGKQAEEHAKVASVLAGLLGAQTAKHDAQDVGDLLVQCGQWKALNDAVDHVKPIVIIPR